MKYCYILFFLLFFAGNINAEDSDVKTVEGVDQLDPRLFTLDRFNKNKNKKIGVIDCTRKENFLLSDCLVEGGALDNTLVEEADSIIHQPEPEKPKIDKLPTRKKKLPVAKKVKSVEPVPIIVQEVNIEPDNSAALELAAKNAAYRKMQADFLSKLTEDGGYTVSSNFVRYRTAYDDSPYSDYEQYERKPRVEASYPVQNRRYLPAGSMISLKLRTSINSELPGLWQGIVSRNSYSDAGVILIPAGSLVTGSYESLDKIGESRISSVVRSITKPNGQRLSFGKKEGEIRAIVTNDIGVVGLGGDLNTKIFERYGVSLFLAGINAGIVSGIVRNSDSNNQQVTGILANTVAETTQVIIKEQLDTKPRLTVPAVRYIYVFVDTDIFFPDPRAVRYVDADYNDYSQAGKAKNAVNN